jgi:hypothetical protein
MTMPISINNGSQRNSGSGTFVAGHQITNIEMMDAPTKTAFKRLSEIAPGLAEQLATALREGKITQDAARDLARNINEDIAHWIWEGGRGINEDTARWIAEGGRGINEDTARWIAEGGRGINEHTAGRLAGVAADLKDAIRSLESASRDLNTAGSGLQSAKANATDWARTAAAMKEAAADLVMASQAYSEPSDRFSRKWFQNGIYTGFTAALVLALLVAIITS